MIDALSIGTRTNFFLEYFKTAYDVNLFQNRIGFRWFNSSVKV